MRSLNYYLTRPFLVKEPGEQRKASSIQILYNKQQQQQQQQQEQHQQHQQQQNKDQKQRKRERERELALNQRTTT
jgi:hypothetical protein